MPLRFTVVNRKMSRYERNMTNQEKLNAWCRAVHGRTVELAVTIGVSRPTLDTYRSGSTPSQEIAQLIDNATGGRVPADGWGCELENYALGQLLRMLKALGCVDAAGLPDPAQFADLVEQLNGQTYGGLRLVDGRVIADEP